MSKLLVKLRSECFQSFKSLIFYICYMLFILIFSCYLTIKHINISSVGILDKIHKNIKSINSRANVIIEHGIILVLSILLISVIVLFAMKIFTYLMELDFDEFIPI
jgi:hypothetical protein